MLQHFGEIGESIENISAILVTHEHIDHTKSLQMLANKYNIPIYANAKTWKALKNISDNISFNNKVTFDMLKDFEIGSLKIFAFPTPHDAASPCGFNIYSDNKKLSIATDIGFISKDLFKHLENSSSILIESNYDPEILKVSPYPYLLKQRIAGQNRSFI